MKLIQSEGPKTVTVSSGREFAVFYTHDAFKTSVKNPDLVFPGIKIGSFELKFGFNVAFRFR